MSFCDHEFKLVSKHCAYMTALFTAYFHANISIRLFSSPEPKETRSLKYRQAPSSVRPSSARPSLISNDFSVINYLADCNQISYTASRAFRKENSSNSLGHITKMAAIPIYGKNFKKSFSP